MIKTESYQYWSKVGMYEAEDIVMKEINKVVEKYGIKREDILGFQTKYEVIESEDKDTIKISQYYMSATISWWSDKE